ncbi:MAG: hypothetical protein GF364_18275 [Candidatus Lokiarchaeota archaeon]|nr:hypothetical protein [Candidatus Lokiarchaeota archaeon]
MRDMFSYVFNEGKWIETDKIYPHDIALFLDPKEEKIYIWQGPRVDSVVEEDIEPYIDELKIKYEKFKFEKLGDVIPLKVEKEIEEKLDVSFETTQKIDRDPQYFMFLVFGFLGLISMAIMYIFILNPLGWDASNELVGIKIVSEVQYERWIELSQTFLIVSIVIFELLFVCSILTKKIFLISTAGLASLIQLGTYKYISLGVYLFDFQSGADPGYYHILVTEIAYYTLLHILAIVAVVIPIIISISAIFKDTKPISFKDWKAKRAEKAIDLRKYSIITRTARFIGESVDNPENLPSNRELLKKNKKTIDIKLKPID